jgi:acetyl-CoA synthetase
VGQKMPCSGYLVANWNWWNYDCPVAFVTPTKPTYATLPLPGVQQYWWMIPVNEIEGNQVVGNLCIKSPWPGIARTI